MLGSRRSAHRHGASPFLGSGQRGACEVLPELRGACRRKCREKLVTTTYRAFGSGAAL